jgi:hypothetical protein
MPKPTFEDVYQRFVRIWTNSEPVVDRKELEAAMNAMGVAPEDAREEWLRSLNRDWVYGRTNRPFGEEELNRKYWRIMAA